MYRHFRYEANEVVAKDFFEFIKSWVPKPPLPYVIMVIVVGLGGYLLARPGVKEFLFGPEWEYDYNLETETAVFRTDTELKSGRIRVSAQVEIKYGGRIYYIFEVRGLYNINEASLSGATLEEGGGNGEKEASMFCLTIEKGQREKLDTFEEGFQELLEEHLSHAYHDDFGVEKLEMEEKLVAEIDYQSVRMNKSRPMYISVSGKEVSTINKREAALRSPNTFIDLDELSLNESFYTNEKIMSLMEACMEEIHKGMR